MANKFATLVLVKAEAVKGVGETPTPAANAIRVVSATPNIDGTKIERKLVKTTMGAYAHLIGKKMMSAEIVVEMRGSGTAGTPPEYDPLLQACRSVVTNVPATSDAYAPSSADASEKTATVWIYHDGQLYKFIGAVCSCKIDGSMDAIIKMTFSVQAGYLEPTTTAVASGAVYDSTQPIVMSNACIFNDGAVVNVGSFGLDLGNELVSHYRTNEDSYSVDDRAPELTFNKDSVSTIAEWQALNAMTDMSISITLGTVAGNRCVITAPAGRRVSVKPTEDGVRNTRDLTVGLYESTSDDQWQLLFN